MFSYSSLHLSAIVLSSQLFKGRLESGIQVAIRCLPTSKKYSIRNLKLRLDMLAKIRHPHLVCILGHCIQVKDDGSVNRVFLVYEYIPNGNFRSHLSGKSWDSKIFFLGMVYYTTMYPSWFMHYILCL